MYKIRCIRTKNFLHLCILNLRLIFRYKKFEILGILFFLFFLAYLNQDNNVVKFNLVLLMLLLFEPYFTKAVKGVINILPQYVLSGVDLVYVVLANNLVALAISSTGIVILILGFWINSKGAGWQILSPGVYFCTSIFPLIILGNYVSIIKMLLGFKEDNSIANIVLRYLIHSLLIILASIPYLLFQHLFQLSIAHFIVILFIFVWYVTVIYHIARLARRNLSCLLEV